MGYKLLHPLVHALPIRRIHFILHFFQLPAQLGNLVDSLSKLSVRHLKGGAQRFMPFNQQQERFLQPGCIQLTFKLHSHRHVIPCSAPIELLRYIYSPLGGRRRISLQLRCCRNSVVYLFPAFGEHKVSHLLNCRIAEYVLQR
ncbi:hypothetical protein D3C77_265190 [compost metagenome]